MPILPLLALNAAISLAAFLVLWIASWRTKDPSFVDSWWALGLVLIACGTYLSLDNHGPHATALTLLCALWGLRLGFYLLWRWMKHGPDRRYAAMMHKAKEQRGWSYAKASLLFVFLLQAPLQFIVSLPVQLGQIPETETLGPLAMAGVALALIGIAFETIADAQLVHFKEKPENAGKILDAGVWRYTRHPNYFGDACAWWGLYLIAAETGLGLWSLPGPLLLTFLLTRWSGVPTVEGRMRCKRPEYEAYAQRTSTFFPWPPKRA